MFVIIGLKLLFWIKLDCCYFPWFWGVKCVAFAWKPIVMGAQSLIGKDNANAHYHDYINKLIARFEGILWWVYCMASIGRRSLDIMFVIHAIFRTIPPGGHEEPELLPSGWRLLKHWWAVEPRLRRDIVVAIQPAQECLKHLSCPVSKQFCCKQPLESQGHRGDKTNTAL